jgi:hypothetical protein
LLITLFGFLLCKFLEVQPKPLIAIRFKGLACRHQLGPDSLQRQRQRQRLALGVVIVYALCWIEFLARYGL